MNNNNLYSDLRFAKCFSIIISQYPWEGGAIILILRIRKLKYSDLPRDHTTSMYLRLYLNLGLLDFTFRFPVH